MTENGRETERGFALVIVLWIAALLSAVLVGALALSQNQIRATAGDRMEMHRDAALRSALEIVAFDISQIGRSHVASLPVQLNIGGRLVTVRAGGPQRLLDINMANEVDFANLFRQVGQDDQTARMLADRIMDWRDADDLPRALGAEASAYANRPADAPRNRPFISVEELQRVSGLSQSLWSCVAPYLTVLGGTPAPARDSGILSANTEITGMRVALEARTSGRSGSSHKMTALAEFGLAAATPHAWVAFGDDRLESLGCRSGGGA